MVLVDMPSFGVLLKRLIQDRSDRSGNSSPNPAPRARPRPITIRRLTPPPQPSFLGIPLELRQHIYEEMLQLPARDHIALLCVCKRVFHEGKEHFYHRPLNCDSQDALNLFVLRHAPDTLQQIQTLNVRFQEVDPALMQPALALLVAGLAISSQQHPYFDEIERVTRSLTSMSNVKQLSIMRPIERQQNPPSRDFFDSLCSWVQKHYTQLHGLTISVEHTSLRFVSHLRLLRTLEFSGFSVTQPEEMVDILSRLPSLDELRIIGPPRGLCRRQRYGYQHRFVVQSFTDSVLHGMRPLKKLSICEFCVPTYDDPTFLTNEVLKALYLTHRDSIRQLTVHSETSLDPSVESLLMAFLMSTKTLTTLSIGWPGMNNLILDSLPIGLCHLTVTVSGLHSQQLFRNRLRSLDSRLRYLRSIHFTRFDGNGPP